jgi:hypothetical protein
MRRHADGALGDIALTMIWRPSFGYALLLASLPAVKMRGPQPMRARFRDAQMVAARLNRGLAALVAIDRAAPPRSTRFRKACRCRSVVAA